MGNFHVTTHAKLKTLLSIHELPCGNLELKKEFLLPNCVMPHGNQSIIK
jgi:hypothetical protein